MHIVVQREGKEMAKIEQRAKKELFDCSITDEGCAALASALRSNPSSHLRELNLNYDKPGDSGVKQLSAVLEDPHCKLEKLQLLVSSLKQQIWLVQETLVRTVEWRFVVRDEGEGAAPSCGQRLLDRGLRACGVCRPARTHTFTGGLRDPFAPQVICKVPL
ncbi:hypothetical protein P4O66_004106 [Electrophorus voltai]|uniref:Uncharacterized protein n=1 Tax=Electrophorus voltai TaxID=2609070 RepID=A0AAD8ZQA9_9TELE|nr:hypothetical protein P4O66_004106 [Electrophorus voltai]